MGKQRAISLNCRMVENFDKAPLAPKRNFLKPKNLQQKINSGEELSITTEVKNIVTKEDDIETTSILTDLIEHGNESTTDVVITLVNTESGKEKRKKDKNEDTIILLTLRALVKCNCM